MRFAAVSLALCAIGVHAQTPPASRLPPAPPNAPATVVIRGADVQLRYHGITILDAQVSSTGVAPRLRTLVDSSGGKITQVISWTAGDGRVTLRGTIHGTRDAFAVDADPRENGVPIVRHSVGPSYSTLNRGVYARSGAWLLSRDFPSTAPATRWLKRNSPSTAPITGPSS